MDDETGRTLLPSNCQPFYIKQKQILRLWENCARNHCHTQKIAKVWEVDLGRGREILIIESLNVDA